MLSVGGRSRKYSAPIPLMQSTTFSTWATKDDISSDTLVVDIFAGEGPLTAPSVELSAVDGTARIISITSIDKGTEIEYTLGEETFSYNAPFSISDTSLIVARSKYVDAFSNEVAYSELSELEVAAGTEIKLNPVVFMTSIHDMAQGLTAVNMKSDVTNILLHPEVSIVYTNFTNMTMQTVSNDTTIITNNTRITAFATYPGYVNSDTTYIDVVIQSLEDITAPYISFVEAKSDGSRVFQVRNTAEGYPVPVVYYYTEGKTQPKAVVGNIVTIPRSEYGWVRFYAAADGYSPSPIVTYYVDSRTNYVTPYEVVTPENDNLPASAGDLEFWNARELNIENYPTTGIKTSGNIYYHLKVHDNFNDLVLPFTWNEEDNIVTNSKGETLVLGRDFWLYEISTLISSDNIANGTLSVNKIRANSSYLIKVTPSLVGDELTFKSTNSYTFQILQTDFSDIVARTDYIIRPNKRYQKVDVDYTVYKLNKSGTAFVKHIGGTTVDPFTTIIIAPFSFAYENDSIELVYHPKFDVSPTPGSMVNSLDHVDITLRSYPKMKLHDDAYMVNGSKKLYIYKNGTQSNITAQLERLTNASFRFVLSNTIQTDGQYTINLPDGFFEVFKNAADTEPFAFSRPESYSYSILTEFTATSNPPEGQVDKLKDITITFNKQITLSGNGEVVFSHNGNVLYTFNSSQVTTTSNTLKVSLPKEQTEGGSYQVLIPAGFLLINGYIPQSEDLRFNYYTQIVYGAKHFENDTTIWLNGNTLPTLIYEGWLQSNAGSSFDITSFNIKYLNPADDSYNYGSIGAIKVSNTPETIINLAVANVDSIVFYLANPASWTYYTNFSGETEGESFTYGATATAKAASYFGIRLNNKKEWTMKAWGNNLANYLYAIKVFVEMPPMAIEDITEDQNEVSLLYDLNGRIVKNPEPNKFYIKNGKKYLFR